MGKLVRTRGNTAQWMAQASEAEIPSASQLIREFIRQIYLKYKNKCNAVAKFLLYCKRIPRLSSDGFKFAITPELI